MWISKGDFISVCSDKLLKSIHEERVEGICYSIIAVRGFIHENRMCSF